MNAELVMLGEDGKSLTEWNAMNDADGLLAADMFPLARGGSGPVAQLMRERALHAVFQPIADLKDGSIHAHEALLRGPSDTAWHSPEVLLHAAQSEGLLHELEFFCVLMALRQWGEIKQPGRLFVNISASALVRLIQFGGVTSFARYVREQGMAPRMVVLEITEHERVGDVDELAGMVEELRSTGCMMALDDFGDGHSSLRLWSQIKPDIVKIDRYFCRDISVQADKIKTMQALLQIAETFGTSLVAEGIETEDDLRAIRDLGFTYGQGYFIGRPARAVEPVIRTQAIDVLLDARVAVLPERQQISRLGHLRHLALIHAPCVSSGTSNDEVAKIFQARPELHAIAVVEHERPVAIINRQSFMDRYATLYFREIFGKKPCTQIANFAPRLIERTHDIDELVGILTSQDQRYLSDGFIVTENGRYIGLGTGDQLVRSVTELRLEAARHANPLTFLPGNIPISLHVRRLLDSGAEFTACYLDLNHFKPFNDHYGYWRGDEMIRLLGRLAVAHCDSQRDFVGHVGGDDFLILFQSGDWRQRCQLILDEFADKARELYDDEARLAGGIRAEDRYGAMRFFPCATLAIGAVPVRAGQFHDPEEVATRAALAKHEAKVSGHGLTVLPAATGAADREPVAAA